MGKASANAVKATIWFDGACSGNPGPMGLGAVVQLEGDRPQVLSMAKGHGTNNQAEYHAAILGLRHALAAGATDIVLTGDSQLILRQLKGEYQVRRRSSSRCTRRPRSSSGSLPP